MTVEQEIIELKRQIRLNEMSDDGYYLSAQYKEDAARLSALRSALKK